ncbi:hypothetical protein F5883DRAFT_408563, partial [Diaporthe sp. PMI_573]
INIVKGSLYLASLLYQPEYINSMLLGVIVLYPIGRVKKQTASIYAKRLSKEGYVAITFNASNQGNSRGLPYFLKDPNARVTNVSTVVNYLERLNYIDPKRVTIVRIYAGSSYTAAAAIGNYYIKAVAIVSAVNFGDGTRLS